MSVETAPRRTGSMKFTCEPDTRPLPGYTIRRAICRGGFGEVYFAVTDAGKEVALKLIFAEQSEKELRGITQCLNLKHANLVNLFDVKQDVQGRSWVIMEYVGGSSLEDVLTTFPEGLPPAEVESWLAGIVAGVGFLHEHGIAHRDLKPANIYREQGVVKVGDVGLSRRLEGPRAGQYTESIGTVYYMAPEVAHGQYGAQVDVYSLGIILYEMLTGRVPFEGETTGEVLMKHLSAAPDLERLPRALRPVLARALQKDPAKRTRTPMMLLQELQAALHGAQALPDHAFLPEARFRPVPALTQPATVSHSPAGSTAVRSHEAEGRTWWPWVVLAFVLWAIWAPHTVGWFQIAMTIGAVMLVVRLTKRSGAAAEPQAAPVRPPALPPPAPVRPAEKTPVRYAFSAQQVAWSWVVAAVGGLAVSCAAYWGSQSVRGMPLTQTPEGLGCFAAVTIVGAWLLTSAAQLARAGWWTFGERRWLFLGTGAMLGGAAFLLDQLLLFDVHGHPPSRTGLSGIGAIPLWDLRDGQPTLAAYVVCFALLAWTGRWMKLTDPARETQFRLWPLVGVGFLAFVIAMIFSFPTQLLTAWGVTLAATVQLASLRSPGRLSAE